MLDLYRLSEFCTKRFKHGKFSQISGKKKSKVILNCVTYCCRFSGNVIRIRLKSKCCVEYIDLREVQRQKNVAYQIIHTQHRN